jgi:hypothetical protein
VRDGPCKGGKLTKGRKRSENQGGKPVFLLFFSLSLQLVDLQHGKIFKKNEKGIDGMNFSCIFAVQTTTTKTTRL